jgi:choline dehydrogenase-like flavoprotein
MLPLEQGGVVGPDLRVHGVSNLRVADSSVYPIQFAAHLMVRVLARPVPAWGA